MSKKKLSEGLPRVCITCGQKKMAGSFASQKDPRCRSCRDRGELLWQECGHCKTKFGSHVFAQFCKTCATGRVTCKNCRTVTTQSRDPMTHDFPEFCSNACRRGYNTTLIERDPCLEKAYPEFYRLVTKNLRKGESIKKLVRCLKCRQEFSSAHRGTRICGSCVAQNHIVGVHAQY